MSRALCLLTLVLAMTPAAVQANISAPWSPGDAVSEPWGALREVEILGETLELDLRPLAKGGDVAVTAHYRVRSPRLDRKLDLVFVTPGIIRGTVSLDGADLAGVGEEVSDLPKQWKDDLVTPDVDGGELRLEVNRSQRLIRFGAALSAGKIHELKVHFTMLPGRYDPTHSLNATHQVGYLLAPARQWGRFGGLKVKALLPAGWEAAASPALVRQGDTLEGSFKGIPSDLLAISARKPAM